MTREELEKLLAAATPGPWSEQDGSIGRFVKGRYEWSSIADVETAPDRDAAEGEGRANALLICAAVNALPELLERVKRYESAASIETKGSLPWWIDQAAKHAEDMGEEGFLIDRDHWERIVFAAQTEVGRAAIRAMGGE